MTHSPYVWKVISADELLIMAKNCHGKRAGIDPNLTNAVESGGH